MNDEASPDFFIRGHGFAAPRLEPGLHVVATPIGNLGDVTIRALETLAAADIVACEDTRITARLLARYRIEVSLTAYHEHSGPGARARLLAALGEGKAVALASDAGTPLVSDPGYRLVVEAAAAGHKVHPVPGPSSVMAALSAAGLPTDAFLFAGFLPSKRGGRRQRLGELAAIPATLVLMESPNRIAAMLADAAEILGDREAALCREITKLHETFDRAALGDLAERYAGAETKGEIVIVVAPPGPAAAPAAEEIDEKLRAALAGASLKEAAAQVAAETGLPRRDLYQRALALKDGG